MQQYLHEQPNCENCNYSIKENVIYFSMPMKTSPTDTTKSLKVLHPELADEFNEFRNGILATEVSSASKASHRYWWKCVAGHEWDATMRSRVEQNNKCPYCSGRKATAENNLLAKHPEIAVMFNETANGVPASEVTPTFNGKMHWICPENHVFIKAPKEVIRTKGLCNECNSLAFKFPELESQYSENNTIAFKDLSYGSNKKVNWVCEDGHEYSQTVDKKTTRNFGCPFCSGRYATKENNLALAYPEIAKQFDAEKSGTTADKVTPKSNLLMWWNCEKGHSYKTSPNKKTREDLPYGCPFCSSYQIDSTNSLQALFPEIAKEFDAVSNGITADEIAPASSKKYKWKCLASGHSYISSPSGKTRKKLGCPYCSGRYATSVNNFAVARPKAAKEFHPTKNGGLTAYDFTPGSNKKVHWICVKGHEWVTSPNAKKGCPGCTLSATSKIEGFLRDALKANSVLTAMEDSTKKLSICWRKNSLMTVDILGIFNGHKVAIEYDGYYFHSGIRDGNPQASYLKDTQKTEALLNAGYKVIRIRESSTNGILPLVDVSHPNLLQIRHRYHNKQNAQSFGDVCRKVSDWLNRF